MGNNETMVEAGAGAGGYSDLGQLLRDHERHSIEIGPFFHSHAPERDYVVAHVIPDMADANPSYDNTKLEISTKSRRSKGN